MFTETKLLQHDIGVIEEKSQLPVYEMSFLQKGGQGNITLGPLECSGTGKSLQEKSNIVNFTVVLGVKNNEIQI